MGSMTPDEARAKAWGLFRMRVTGALDPFRSYGMDVYIPGAVRGIEQWAQQLVEDLGQLDHNNHRK